MAIQLIKFIKTKAEEIEGISIVEINEKKTVVRKIVEEMEETPNKSHQEIEQKKTTEEMQDVNNKILTKSNLCKEQKIEQTRLNITESQKEKEKNIKEARKLKVKNWIKAQEEAASQKKKLEEIKVLNVIKEEDKTKSKDTQREVINVQNALLNITEKSIERDKTIQNNLKHISQKSQAIEKFIKTEKENTNAIIEALSLKAEELYENKRKYEVSKETERKKRKIDSVEQKTNELKQTETDSCAIMAEENKSKSNVGEKVKTADVSSYNSCLIETSLYKQGSKKMP